ncbi:MAG: hypothetical protein QNJ65_09680 [Xenococcaceae cyanobacterium MO_234.B1]|nr:hypothetical protein [Xenococcaceae cyanobacterium MO_234.B1]
MENQLNSGNQVLTKVTKLLEEEKPLPTLVFGGHNVFNNSISNSVVVQLNVTGEDLAEALEKTPESMQKKVLDAILSVLEKKHSETST